MENVIRVLNDFANTVCAPYNEQIFKKELKLIKERILMNNGHISSVETVIYSPDLFPISTKYGIPIRSYAMVDIIDQLIRDITKTNGAAHSISTLYWHYLKSVYQDKFILFSDMEVDFIKGVVWFCYYTDVKQGFVRGMDVDDILMTYIGCDHQYLENIDETNENVFEMVMANVVSLKDNRLKLLPFPACANISDVLELISLICPWKIELSNLARVLHNHPEREHYLTFIIEQLRDDVKCL